LSILTPGVERQLKVEVRLGNPVLYKAAHGTPHLGYVLNSWRHLLAPTMKRRLAALALWLPV
jgi:hypothetical protein